MDEFDVECEDCGWQGFTTDLLSKTEDKDDLTFAHCPDCGEKEYIVDIDPEDDEYVEA